MSGTVVHGREPREMAHYLESVKLYGPPNPALAEILTGPRLRAIVADYTERVQQTYEGTVRRNYGTLAESSRADVSIGGYKSDRWIGTVTATADYAAANEFGRREYNPYGGDHALRNALNVHLPDGM